jgi:hypothetical protein
MAVDAIEGLLRLCPNILLGGLQKIMSSLTGNISNLNMDFIEACKINFYAVCTNVTDLKGTVVCFY